MNCFSLFLINEITDFGSTFFSWSDIVLVLLVLVSVVLFFLLLLKDSEFKLRELMVRSWIIFLSQELLSNYFWSETEIGRSIVFHFISEDQFYNNSIIGWLSGFFTIAQFCITIIITIIFVVRIIVNKVNKESNRKKNQSENGLKAM